jgi:hypothetical protein
MPNSIKSVRWVDEYQLKLVFKDGFVTELDLRPIATSSRGQMDAPLRDVEFFSRVECDGFTIAWPNGYDICPDVLRYWCEIGRVASKEETDAYFLKHFSEKSSILALNDKTPSP